MFFLRMREDLNSPTRGKNKYIFFSKAADETDKTHLLRLWQL